MATVKQRTRCQCIGLVTALYGDNKVDGTDQREEMDDRNGA